MASITVSEANRARETFRYDAGLIAASVANTPEQLIPSSQLRSSSDAVLTALAQLAVLRLKASRAIISLFDSDNQYIVAEATPTLSLRPNASAASVLLWLSGTHIPRSSWICSYVLGLQPTDSDEGKLPVCVVDDPSQDARFLDRSLDRDWPSYRFYAGVPICTRHGINIGVLSVYDDKPRHGLDGNVTAMRELSAIIMDHFETKRSSIANRLGEHMIRGVGEFVDESTTLSRKNARKKFGLRSKEVNVKSELASCKDKPPELLPSGQISPAIALSVESTPTQLSQWQRPLVLSADWSEKDNPFGNEKLPVSMASVNSNASATSTDRRKGQSYTSQVWSIFDKASTIVRESMDVDGVVFVEARLSVFGVHGDINRPWGLRVSGSSSSSGDDVSIPAVPTSHDADEEGYAVQSSRSVLASDGPQGPADPAPFNLWEKLLRKLLRRYPRGNIFNFDEFGAEQSSDWSSEEATSANHISAHSGEENRRKLCSNRFRMGQSEQDMLMKMLPGARCIAFAPVWDPQDQRWFAGSFAYTKSRNRVFTARGDLSYLIAFGAVAMNEVCRLRATLADNSKMDMLSSLSHELRSPLHGMVLGLEMLQDTSLDRFQKDIVHTVESCTRTLLDTVNHLLDWTKINNLSTKRPARKVGVDISGRSTEKPLDHDSLTTNTAELNLASGSSAILLDALTEEVVESVFAGYTYQQLTVACSVKSTPNGDNRDHLRRFDGIHATTDDYEFTHPQHVILSGSKDILVNLCIDPAATWSFNTQPGAIRRIIMNLLGNCLKYTATGSITVRVSQSSAHSHRLNNVRTHGHVRTVRIVVSDTGRGISENYLKNHLFVPFSQEDRLSPGVGLGLSLVKRIASALGGYVQVQSRVGQGTTITVSLPLEKSAHSREHPLHAQRFRPVDSVVRPCNGCDPLVAAPFERCTGHNRIGSSCGPCTASNRGTGPRPSKTGRDPVQLPV